MPITAVCPTCSKQFKVRDELAGKTIKCVACGRVMTIPSGAPVPVMEMPAPATVRARAPVSASPPMPVVEPPVNGEPEPEAFDDRPRKRKKKKKGKGAGFSMPTFSILGRDMSLTTLLVGLAAVLLVGGATYYICFVVFAAGGYHIIEMKRTDVFAAIDARRTHWTETGRLQNEALQRGDGRFLVSRDGKEGNSVFLRIKLSQGYLEKNEKFFKGTLIFYNTDFIMNADGQKIMPLFVFQTYTDGAKGMYIAPHPKEQERFNPLKFDREGFEDGGSFTSDSTPSDATWKGPRGLEVNVSGMYEVKWNEGSLGHLSGKMQEYPELLGTVDVNMIFPDCMKYKSRKVKLLVGPASKEISLDP